MFKKSTRRNFQGRLHGNAAADDNEGMDGKPIATTKTEVPIKQAVPSVSRLFEPDVENATEDGVEFQIKKSRRSQKLAEKQREASRRERYIDEATLVLNQASIADIGSRPSILNDDIMPGEVAEQAGVYICDTVDIAPAIEQATGAHEFRKTIQSSRIPNAKLIFEAKRQRQMARLHGDVIPISTHRVTNSQEGTPEVARGRLMREENSDHSDEEDSNMPGAKSAVRFMAHSQADILRRRAENEAELDERVANLTANDEDDEWEREQLKKVQSSVNAAAKIRSALSAHQTSNSAANGNPAVISIPASLKISIQLIEFSDMKERVGRRLHAVHDALSTHTTEQFRSHAELGACSTKITHYNEKLPKLANESDFYKEMTDYVHSALECYSAKTDQIERIIDEARQVRRLAQEHCVLARKTFVKDMDDDVRAVPLPVATPDVIERKRRLQQHDEKVAEKRRRRNHQPTAVDYADDGEFSCDADDILPKLRAILAERDTVFSDAHEDFYSIPKILSRFTQWYIEFDMVYDDAYVDECLAKLLAPVVKWNMLGWIPWKITDDDSSMPIPLAQLPWFQQMQLFSEQRRMFRQQQLAKNGSANGADTDERRSLVQMILENVVFQALSLEIYAWDPYSTAQTEQLVDFLHYTLGGGDARHRKDEKLVDSEHANVATLLENIKKHTVKVIADTVYFPLYPRQILESNAYAVLFYNKQFWSISKLFGNLLKFYGILSNADLKQITVTSLLNRYLLMPLRTIRDSVDTLEKACRLGELLPPLLCEDWCMAFDEGTTPVLQELSNQCYAVAKSNIEKLRKSLAAGGDRAVLLQYKSGLERVAVVLKKLKDFKSAHAVEKEMQLLFSH